MRARSVAVVAITLVVGACATTTPPVVPSTVVASTPLPDAGSALDAAALTTSDDVADASIVDAGSAGPSESAACVAAEEALSSYAKGFTRCRTDADCILVREPTCRKRGPHEPPVPTGEALGAGHDPKKRDELARAVENACAADSSDCHPDLLKVRCDVLKLSMPVAGGGNGTTYDRRCKAYVPCAPPFSTAARWVDETGRLHFNDECR